MLAESEEGQICFRFHFVLKMLAESEEGQICLLKTMYEVWSTHPQVIFCVKDVSGVRRGSDLFVENHVWSPEQSPLGKFLIVAAMKIPRTVKIPEKFGHWCKYPNIGIMWFYHRVMHPKDAVWSGFTLYVFTKKKEKPGGSLYIYPIFS